MAGRVDLDHADRSISEEVRANLIAVEARRRRWSGS